MENKPHIQKLIDEIKSFDFGYHDFMHTEAYIRLLKESAIYLKAIHHTDSLIFGMVQMTYRINELEKKIQQLKENDGK